MLQNGFAAGEETIRRDTLNRLAAIGQISAGIAHEVRNPLTSVKGFLQLLQMESPHRYTEIALSELERAIETLQNFLHVSKPDLHDEPFSSFSLYSEFESILYLFQDKMYDIKVNHQFENKNEMICGKRNQLKKAFFNLIKNAFEAIPGQGEIEIRQYRLGDTLYLTIRDTGIGIPEEKLGLLGTPFFTTKNEGTGMGLAQIFSTVYQHNASIEVESEVGKGTTFTIKFPVMKQIETEVEQLELLYTESNRFVDFYMANKDEFQTRLMREAEQAYKIVQESSQSIDLFRSAQNLILVLDEEQYHEVISLAKEQGRLWAKADLPLSLRLEWNQAFRKVYWEFLYNFHLNSQILAEDVFKLARNNNYMLDTFLTHLSASFAQYKDELLDSQRDIIEELTVPIIPISTAMAVLPLVGTLDTFRAKKLQERVLNQCSLLKIKRIIFDLSGVPYMDTAVVSHIFKIIDGISLLGCKAVITGIRPEIVNTMIELGIEMPEKVATFGTMQQAIEEYGIN